MDFISFPPQTEHDLNCADDNHSLTDAAVSMMLWFDESWAAVGKHSLFSCSLITSLGTRCLQVAQTPLYCLFRDFLILFDI